MQTRLRVLLLGYRPPPWFGPSVTYQALLRSDFARQHHITFVDLTVARNFRDLERFQVRKLFRFAGTALQEVWFLLTRRFDFCCAPVSLNRNAFLRDALLLAFARWRGVPTVVYAHGNHLPAFHDRSPPWLQRVIRRTFEKAAAGIVLGESLRFNLERWLPPDRIFAVPTGIEPVDLPARQLPPTDRLTILYLGNLIREKGYRVLLEAAAQMRQSGSSHRFIFAGQWHDERDAPVVAQWVRDAGLEDQVEFVGPVSGRAKWQLLVDADILAFPTFYPNETMGLVLLEAMQAGLPVVTTRRASIPEIIQDGVNGLLVAEQDPADLAEKLTRLAADPALRRRISAANRQRFADHYTHEQYGARMTGVFTALRYPARVSLFGVPIDNLTLTETLDRIEELIRQGPTHQHVVVNVDKLVKMQRDPALRAAVLQCDLINVDGMPVVWASRLLGAPLKERVAGIDLFIALTQRCAERGLRVYLLGAEETIVARAVERLKELAPNLTVAGWRNGYWSEAEEPAVAQAIRAARPDVLFVAISSPKKELFVQRWKTEMQVPFVMGVGGSFDVVAGKVNRAPRWMQQSGLEWLYRLAQEPRRMWRRYLVDDLAFVPLVWREWRARRR